MDFITKLLVVILMISLFVEVLWIISPRALKKYIVRLDRQSLIHSSKSASVAFSMGIWCLITKLAEVTDSWKHKSRENKTLFKTGQEKAFRQASHYRIEIHLYILMMICSVWMTINFQCDVFCREAEHAQVLENPTYVTDMDVLEGKAPRVIAPEKEVKPKSAKAKKDD